MNTIGCQADSSVLLPSDSVHGSREVRPESVLGASVLAALVSVGIGAYQRTPAAYHGRDSRQGVVGS